MSDTRQRLADFSPEKLALLSLRLKKKREAEAAKEVPLRRQETLSPVPSFAQERLWFLDQIDAGAAYNDSLALELRGDLRHYALLASLQTIVDRHEVLRYSFTDSVEGPQVSVVERMAVTIPTVDLSGLSHEGQEETMKTWLRRAVGSIFDLSSAPLWCVGLLRCGPGDHVLVLVVHHTIIDGWSWNVLLQELALHYGRFLSDSETAPMQPLPVQFGDFARWQRGLLSGESLEELLEGWRRRLEGAPPVLELPLDRPRPQVQTLRGRKVSLEVPATVVGSLRYRAKETGATIFMAVLAAALVVLRRFSGQSDLVLGTPVLGRNRPELEGLIGVFINTVVLRHRWSEGGSFRELLTRVREDTLDAFAGQDLPFEKLVEALDPDRTLSHAPLFQVLFELQPRAPEMEPVAGITFRSLPLEAETTRFDLGFSFEEGSDSLRGALQYNLDLFDATTIHRMAKVFELVVQQVAEGWHRPLREVAVFSPGQHWQILGEWSSAALIQEHKDLSGWLVSSLRRRGDEVAVQCGERQLSGFQLEADSARLCRVFRHRDLQAGDRVGVLLQRGVDLVTVLVAALRSGLTYVPLDPSHPRQRIHFALDDVGARAVVVDGETAHLVQEGPWEALAVDAEQGGKGDGEPSLSVGQFAAESLAYVIYTSGSTGRPKGVEVPRGSLRYFLESMAFRPGLVPGDTVLAVTTVAFDIAILEIFLPLLCGARVVVARPDELADPEALSELLQSVGATVMQATPATWRLLMESGWRGQPGLRIFCGGEALPTDLGRFLTTHCDEVWNLYGPTETTVWSACHRLDPSDLDPVPLGRPLPGTEMLIVDPNGSLVPLGCAGELLIGGPGVSAGYRGRPGLTAERFLPHPWCRSPGARLYRTGDRVRQRPDGLLDFMGRLDFQVKFRGYRIELGEIESALRRLPEVLDAAVQLQEASPENRLLVAYLVIKEGRQIAEGDLRSGLAAVLPSYMIPGAFVLRPTLPLGPSGKLDRKALAAVRVEDDRPMREARTSTEATLVKLWKSLLGRSALGIDQSFFDLGGHSLLAARLMLRIQEEFGIRPPLVKLFQAPTIELLASWVDEALKVSSPSRLETPLLSLPRDRPLPASLGQERLWVEEQVQGPSAAYNLPLVLEFHGHLDVSALAAALGWMEARHEVLRTRLRSLEDGQLVQEVANPGSLLMRVVDFQGLPGEARARVVDRWLESEMEEPFCLAEDRLLRVRLLRLGDNLHRLVLVLHHAGADGWSLAILTSELEQAYLAALSGQEPALSPLEIQFGDFAAWQRQAQDQDGEEAARSIEFWRRELTPLPVAELPVDRPRSDRSPSWAGQLRLRVEEAWAETFVSLCRRSDATLFMGLLTAYEFLLSLLTGTPRLVVGSVVAGRDHRATEGLIGFFANTVVDLGDLRGRPTFQSALERTRNRWLLSSEHQELPFDRLVEALRPQRSGSRTPLFQALIVLHNWETARSPAASLEIQRIAIAPSEAKFDLSLSVEDGGQGLGLTFEYEAALFDATTVRRWGEGMRALLKAVCEAPARVLDASFFLTSPQQHQLRVEWPRIVPESPEPSLLAMFEAWAQRAPDQTALTWEGQDQTYGELNARATQLASVLQRRGVGREALVGICLARSMDQVLAILAIGKAGAAYVPLDTEAPSSRLQGIVEDARPALIVTTQEYAGRVSGHEVLLLDVDLLELDEEAPGRDVPILPDQLAYVIFTSGSTGRPKGCLMSHGNQTRLMTVSQRRFGFCPTDVWTLFHSYAFDLSVWEIWGALAFGGRLVLVPPLVSRSPEELYDLLLEEQVTVLTMTPSAFRLLVAEDAARDSEEAADLALRTVIFAGEAIDLSSLRRWSSRHAVTAPTLVNMYGITETTVHVTFHALSQAELFGTAPSPIGRPLEHLSMTLRDRSGDFVPLGATGEIWVGGAGVARGYLHRPGLTAQRFVPDDEAEQPGSRAYRSGDFARLDGGGRFDYRGRIDQQVKIRGFRVEVGEVEIALGELPQVQEAIVLPVEGGESGPRLVAYWVPREEEGAPSDDRLSTTLRRALELALPSYMIPAQFVALERIPLTVNGKVDRRALPLPEGFGEPGGVGARTSQEAALVGIWREVLGGGEIGVHDNFFELGGDSILAIQVVTRARREGLSLTPRDLFEAQTIEALAARVVEEDSVPGEQGILDGLLPWLPIQQEFFAQNLNRAHHFNQALLLEVVDADANQRIAPAVRALWHQHDALRLSFRRHEGRWLQEYQAPLGGSPISRVDLSRIAVAEGSIEQDGVNQGPGRELVSALRRQAARVQKSLDLEGGRAFRAVFFDLGTAHSGRLLLVAHHLVVDGVSWRVLLEDLEDLLHQPLEEGRLPRLPVKGTSYRQWAEALEGWRVSACAAGEEAYWKEQLSRPVSLLPRNRAECSNLVRSMSTISVDFDPETTEALLRRAPRRYRCSVDDLLVAAVAEALLHWSGGDGLRLDLESHGRHESLFPGTDLTRTVGWFTSIFPLVVSREGNIWALVRQIKERRRSAPREGLGFGILSRDAANRRDWGSSEVLVNYFGQLDSALPLGGHLRSAPEGLEGLRSEDQERAYLLEIDGAVQGGKLQQRWSFSAELHDRKTIESVALRFRSNVESLIRESTSRSKAHSAWDLSDFPLAPLPADILPKILAMGNVEDLYGLAPLQEGLLTEALLFSAEAPNLEQLALGLRGPLSPEAFRQAWQAVLDRHTILRTAFLWEDLDSPVQVVLKGLELPWKFQDLRGEEGVEKLVTSLLGQERRQGFDLSRPPLLRVRLLRLEDERWLMLLTHHHILLDGWSLPVLVRELLQHYRANLHGGGLDLPPALPYRDYVGWVQEQDLSAAEAHFRSLLQGVTAPTPLGIDRHGADSSGIEIERKLRVLDLSVTRALQAVAREHHLTLNTLVQGAWALLLNRYSGAEHVLFGSVTSGRSAPLANIDVRVGLFINTVATRLAVSGEAEALDLLLSLQSQQLDSRDFEFCPLSLTRAWSQMESDEPLFRSLVAFENYPADMAFQDLGDEGLEVESVGLHQRPSYPLSLVVDQPDSLRFVFLCNVRQIEPTAAQRALGHLVALLSQWSEGVRRPVRSFGVLTIPEQQQLASEWPCRKPSSASPLPLERFLHWAQRSPEAGAVCFETLRWSYGELESRANQLARWLQRQGVAAECLVGICLERSAETVLAILAVLKAGGAYVPLDPGAPPERLRYMADDADLSLILTTAELGSRFPQRRILALDAGSSWRSEPSELISQPIHEQQLAYVIYTSGSTGNPKGCAVTHGNLGRLLAATDQTFSFGTQDVWTLFHSFAFDFSVWELWGALAYGGRLVVVPYWVSRSTEELYRLMLREGVTVLNMTPSAFRLVAREDEAAAPEEAEKLALRWIIFGGEAVDLASLRSWSRRRGLTRPRLVNMYGITETTVHVTTCFLEPHHLAQPKILPIGRPIEDLSIALRSASGDLVPIGVAGEIQVGGPGVARGYLNRPRLTATRFIPDADSSEPGARVYRSGDLGRFGPGGTVEYLGRSDHQVKIRGFRIELGEIEAAVTDLPAVAEAIVLARPGGDSGQQIVAYVVPRRDANLEVRELRESLARRLPAYMVPAHLIPLDAIPLTINGKVDRRRLPDPNLSPGGTYASPQGPVESALVEIWQQLLGIETVGVNDNFFEVGGDSILAIQVAARARREGFELTPRQLFESPTIRALASEITEGEGRPCAEEEVERPKGEALLLPIQRDFFAQGLVNPHHYNQALILEVLPGTKAGGLAVACRAVGDQHASLRLRFHLDGERWHQTYAEEGAGAESEGFLTRLDLQALSPAGRAATLEQKKAAAQRAFQLARGPLFRILHFDFGDQVAGRLLLVAHHLIVDGVSWRILLEDIEAAYQAWARGEEQIDLLPERTSYKEWSQALWAWADSAEGNGELAFWQDILASSPPPLPAAGGENVVAEEASFELELPAQVTETLLREASKYGRCRIDDLVAAAVAQALARWTGEARVRLDLEGHGREEDGFAGIDLSRTVGWFTSLYPVLVETGPSPWETLGRLKSVRRRLGRHGLGYGLMRWGQPERAELGSSQILFNYLGQLDSALSRSEIFRRSEESVGPLRSSRQRRGYLFEVNCGVSEGCLHLRWAYGKRLHDKATVRALVRSVEEILLGFASEGTVREGQGARPFQKAWVPTDFPVPGLSGEALERILARGPVEDLYPLAPLQLGMLFHTLQSPQEAAYFQQVTGRIVGNLRTDLLRAAWRQLVGRYGVLRTSFVWEGVPTPLQVVWEAVADAFEELDGRGAGGDSQRRWEELLSADRQRGFVLDQPPLQRFLLSQEGQGEYRFLWSYHHALFDGWSLPILLEELLHTYSSLDAGESLSLPRPRPFRLHLDWLQRRDPGEAETFWRKTLKGFSTPTFLRIPPPASSSPKGTGDGGEMATLVEILNQGFCLQLEAMARRQRVTLNTYFQAAWALLLQRLTGEDDVAFGAVTSGRPVDLPEVERMVGPFINTIPLRLQPRREKTLTSWLLEVQRRQIEAQRFDYSPLFQVQGWTSVEAGSPLFETLLVFENYPVSPSLRSGGGELELRQVELLERTNYPLTCFVVSRQPVELRLGYDRRRFDEVTILRLRGYLKNLLGQMVEDPSCSLKSLNPLSPGERQQLLVEWNDSAAPLQWTETVDRMVARHGVENPEGIALRCGEDSLSYGSLLARVEALAAHLRGLGVGPERLVGVFLERRWEAVVAFLAVWRAGGAYLPLDPSFPQGRLDMMMEDAFNVQAHPVILTQSSLAARIAKRDVKSVLLDGTFSWELPSPKASAMEGPPSLDGLAYVLYTSGSTGKPKGIQISHGSLLNFLASMSRQPGFRQGERWLALTSFSFDISGLELFLPLATGGEVIVATEAEAKDASILRERLQSLMPDVMQATPVTWQLLSDQGWTASKNLRILCGGEALSSTLAQRLAMPRIPVWNLYGPTETTIWSMIFPVAGEVEGSKPAAEGDSGTRSDGVVPIGRPIGNTQVYLSDRSLLEVPTGVVGELVIGGRGLARGYLGRPGPTAERFVPNPFTGKGSRLYRTGDLARRRSDGVVDFLGRLDHQVKVRGLRIELGEIEAVLEGHAAVERAVLLVREDRPGDLRLVAYLRTEGGGATSSALRALCQEVLPEYMVPSHFVFVDEWPLTPNRKLDRKALPAPEGDTAGTRAYVEPKTELEHRVAAIWSEVLGVERVGLEDSFFDLGGHSLLVLDVHGRLRQDPDLPVSAQTLTVAELFQLRTLRTLVSRLQTTEADREQRENQLQEQIEQRRQGADRLRRRQRMRQKP